ncbi:MAG: hypothetical protein GXY34_03595 [Syntrophomonadaceae bacterium]|nr:hypothetical protein [Syntrophomonadaceae bacterium]
MIRNEVLETIYARSIRNYTDQPVEDEQIETLLNAAIWAPNGENSQNWLFTAVKNKEILLISGFIRHRTSNCNGYRDAYCN